MQDKHQSSKFGRQLLGAAIAFVLVVYLVASFVVSTGQEQLIESEAVRIAEIVATQTSAARSTYSAMAVKKLQNDGTGAHTDSATRPGFIPLPAQFLRSMSEQTRSIEDPMYTFKPVSEWNLVEEQGIRDDFQRWAWNKLKLQDKTNPGEPIDWQPVWRVDTINGSPVLRFMAADPASSDTCVSCHNRLELQPEIMQRRIDSGIEPGHQWKKHELLGAFEVDIPLQGPIALAKNRTTSGLLMVLAVTVIGAASVGLFLYIDSVRKQETSQRYEKQAKQDYLTGLPNRLRFEAELDRHMNSDPGIKQVHSVLLLDLNNFKDINDSLGHAAGDSVLIEVAKRLSKVLRDTDLVARLGGDEFAVLLPFSDVKVARDIAEMIDVSINKPLVLDGMSLCVGVSTGITVTTESDTRPQELLRRADMAMYKAKQEKISYSEYDSNEDHNGLSALELIIDLKKAIECDMLELHFQPKYNLRQRRMVGAEALLRWSHPTHGNLRPDYLVAVAERAGLMPKLTFWVMKTALKECQKWHTAGFDLSVAVNLCAANLHDSKLVQQVFTALDEAQMLPDSLILEVTESQVMKNPERAEHTLKTLNSLGIKISLDDYGTGYSSLAYLNQLPISELKLDRTFLFKLFDSEKNRVIVDATVMLARNLNLTLVCEGVEDKKTLAFLDNRDCDQAQGYYLSCPLPADMFLRKLPDLYRIGSGENRSDMDNAA